MIGLPAGYLREPLPQLRPDEEAQVRDLLVRYGALEEPAAKRVAT